MNYIRELEDVLYDDITVNPIPVYVLLKVARFNDRNSFIVDSDFDEPAADIRDLWIEGDAWKEEHGVIITTPKLKVSDDLIICDYHEHETRLYCKYNLPKLKKR